MKLNKELSLIESLISVQVTEVPRQEGEQKEDEDTNQASFTSNSLEVPGANDISGANNKPYLLNQIWLLNSVCSERLRLDCGQAEFDCKQSKLNRVNRCGCEC